jgi:hypothetical protein
MTARGRSSGRSRALRTFLILVAGQMVVRVFIPRPAQPWVAMSMLGLILIGAPLAMWLGERRGS